MAPKNTSRFVDNPPSASPSQDHEEEEESEEEESEEEDQVKTPQKPHKNSPHPPKPKPSSSSEDDEEEGSDDDNDNVTENSPTASDFTVKPISTQTTKNTTKSPEQKIQSKPTSKRTLELPKEDEKKGSTKKKTKLSQENGKETKRGAANSGGGVGYGKVWSEGDEIAVLKGWIDYRNQKGADPPSDMGVFLEFVKGRIDFDVTKNQLYEKVRRLKKKFFVNVEKGEKGQGPVFSKSHDTSTFELSKKIWGAPAVVNVNGANGVDANLKSNNEKPKTSGKVKTSEGKSKKKREVEVEKEDDEKMIVEKEMEKEEGEKEIVKDEVVSEEGDFSSKYPNLIESYNMANLQMSESQKKLMKENISLLDSEKARELDENWKRLQMEEIELFCKKTALMIEQSKLVMAAMK